MEYKIAAMRAEYESAEDEIKRRIIQEKTREKSLFADKDNMARQRKSDNKLKK
jgi:hypothetical protein